MDLSWRQRKFKNIIDLNSPKGKAGEITMSYFLNTETGQIFDQKILFISHGFFKKRIQILDFSNKSDVGLILYNLFTNKGTVELHSGKRFFWRCGFKGWTVSRNGAAIVVCKGLINDGTANYEESSELLLLSGFYLAGKFLRYPVLLALLIYCYVLTLYYHN